MGKVVYTSKSTIERKRGPLRIAHLPGEPQPVLYSVHGEIAEHYKVDPAKLTESHAATIASLTRGQVAFRQFRAPWTLTMALTPIPSVRRN
jgi:hypothetical protein